LRKPNQTQERRSRERKEGPVESERKNSGVPVIDERSPGQRRGGKALAPHKLQDRITEEDIN